MKRGDCGEMDARRRRRVVDEDVTVGKGTVWKRMSGGGKEGTVGKGMGGTEGKGILGWREKGTVGKGMEGVWGVEVRRRL